jgi:hypothetical protein
MLNMLWGVSPFRLDLDGANGDERTQRALKVRLLSVWMCMAALMLLTRLQATAAVCRGVGLS